MATEPLVRRLARLQSVEIEVSVELGRVQSTLREVLALRPGMTVPLNRLASEPAEVFAAGKPVAYGEAVSIDDEFGVRITHVIATSDASAPPDDAPVDAHGAERVLSDASASCASEPEEAPDATSAQRPDAPHPPSGRQSLGPSSARARRASVAAREADDHESANAPADP
jgi:flagellar motor switch protein FliN